MTQMAQAPGASGADSSPPAMTSTTVMGMAAVVAVLVAVFWNFFSRQVRWAINEQADWGHTVVIPFIAGYFVYLQRHNIQRVGLRTTWFGFVPIVLGLGWYMAAVFGPEVLHHHNVRAMGVALTISGTTLLFCGWKAMAWLWFPLVYMFLFGQTISDRFMLIFTERLQDWTAVGSGFLMQVFGMDVEREGNVLTMIVDGERRPLNVAEACSGMRMLMAFLALGTAMAYTGLKRWWQRCLLVLMAFPTAIFVNILRVITLSILATYDTGFAGGDFHSFVGLVWLIPAFLMFLGILAIIRQLVIEPEDAAGV